MTFFWSNVHYNYNVQGSLAAGGSPAIRGRRAHASKGRAWTLRRADVGAVGTYQAGRDESQGASYGLYAKRKAVWQ